MLRRVIPLVILGASSSLYWGAPEEPLAFYEERNLTYSMQLEQYFRDYLVSKYPGRAREAWERSYESLEGFLKSVEPNRNRYREMLGPPAWKTGALERRPHPQLPERSAEWLTVGVGPLQAEGLLVCPDRASGPFPLVIAQHGIGSYPERVFGLDDERGLYHEYGTRLVQEGFAVLAPFNLRSVEHRNRIERLARLADTTLPGIELVRMQALLDHVLEDPKIDPDRVGMWGISLGGMATMFWMPLEPRIQVGIVTAWFNHRRNKMVLPDPRYSCFLETREEHAFFRGWLAQFSDSDVVSLICPRPLLIQHGKQDRIAWWPQVEEEFEASRTHYRLLGLDDRLELVMHEGGHEIHLESGIQFLRRWLLEP